MPQSNVPTQVTEQIGDVMVPLALAFWWTTPLRAFNDRTPMEQWKEDPQVVIDFISSVKNDHAA